MKKCKTPSRRTPKAKQHISPDHHIAPLTPHSATPTAANPRRSLRLTAATPDGRSPVLSDRHTPHSDLKTTKICEIAPPISPATISITPASPQPGESRRKRKLPEKQTAASAGKKRNFRNSKCRNADDNKAKRKVYYKKVVYDRGEFAAGDDVYVKRREDASSDDEDPEVEECRVCFKPAGKRIMIECDDCLNGFHLKCLSPPLRAVPEGDWICNYCVAKKNGEMVQFPEPPMGKKRARTAREKLLSSDLWAARIERFVLSKFLKQFLFLLNL